MPESRHVWRCRDRLLRTDERALVMGIVNVTPDSFSDGGRFAEPSAAVAHALRLVAEGDRAEVGWPPHERPVIYVCGPTSFVEAAATALVELGHGPERIRTERFGPT